MVLSDAVLVGVAYFLSFYLRFDGHIPEGYLSLFQQTVALVVVTNLAFFFVFSLYRGMYRFTGLNDLKNVITAVLLASLTLPFCLFFIFRIQGIPRTIHVMAFLLTLVFIGGVRVGVRMALNRGSGMTTGFLRNGKDYKRILVLGAGFTGEKVVREMLDTPALRMRPVAFLDDNETKVGKSIHGVPIQGRVAQIGKLGDEFDEIVIAIPSLKGEQMRQVIAACEQTGKRFRIMPSIGELIGGQVSVKMIRDVKIEDLLGRDEVRLDTELVSRSYRGKRILITGAGGSIGSELVRQVGYYHPAALGLLDFSEYNLFQIEMDTRGRFEYIPVKAYLADIRIENVLRRAFEDFRPEIVLHAAAYKHVPLQELNPREAVFNNIKGTRLLADLAGESGVERFVLVSTDKAVRPTNVMGASKRVAEMLLECRNGAQGAGEINRDSALFSSTPSAATHAGPDQKNRDSALFSDPKNGDTAQENKAMSPIFHAVAEGGDNGCRYVAVRFGNVLGSSGSVIPIFEQQIAARMPVTVTHPEVTRYFMSIPEAAQLILQAGAMAEGGEIFILDMGQPVRIADMARDLIRLHGLEPDRDVTIRFTGLRPGEKLYEELITEGEGIVPTLHEKIRVIRGRHCDAAALDRDIDALIELAKQSDIPAIKAKLHEIVPEYTPQ